jgi:hypothetical protein
LSYACTTCGETHDALPALGFKAPDYAELVPEKDRPNRIKIDDDLCAVDDELFFIRASLRIPILDLDDTLNLSVWISQKKENFISYIENFDSDEIGPYFGWLSNEFQFRGVSTLNIESQVNFPGNSFRPYIELKESDHPLSIVHRTGISLDEAWQIAHEYLG